MCEAGRLAKEKAEGGKILLIITHNHEFIQSVCTKILCLKNGGITEAQPSEAQSYDLEKIVGVEYGTEQKE